MKIAFIGTHATGKTNLCKQLTEYLRKKGYNALMMREVARKCPMPINEKTSLKAQELILFSQIEEENKHKDHDLLVCDRSVLDNYAYLKRIYGKDHERLNRVMLNHLKTYDILFLTSINAKQGKKIKKDGYRSTNPAFQRNIQKILFSMIDELKPFFEKNSVKLIRVSSFEDVRGFVDSGKDL